MTHSFLLENPQVKEIAIDPYMSVDVHATGGMHAMKESFSWETFQEKLAQAGGKLPEGIADPDNYYMSNEGGEFYRALVRMEGKKPFMAAGIAVSRLKDTRLRVDALYTPDSTALASKTEGPALNTVIASGIHRLLTRQIFDQYSGSNCSGFQSPVARYLDWPLEGISHVLQPNPGAEGPKINLGLLRGIADFAVATEAGFRIPMPCRVLELKEIPEESLATIKKDIPGKAFDGGISYTRRETAKTPEISIDEFYRQGILLGSLKTQYDDLDGTDTITATNSQGEALEFPPRDEEALETHPALRIRFLKLLAENDAQAAELLLA